MDKTNSLIADLRHAVDCDLNPFGRGIRQADRAVMLARLERTLLEWTERHTEAVADLAN